MDHREFRALLRQHQGAPEEAALEDNPYLRYAYTLVTRLQHDFGISKIELVDSSTKRSYVRQVHGLPAMHLGTVSILRASVRWNEYAHLRSLPPHPDLNGTQGVHALTLHEFAHVLKEQAELGLDKERQTPSHGEVYERILRDLWQRYPLPVESIDPANLEATVKALREKYLAEMNLTRERRQLVLARRAQQLNTIKLGEWYTFEHQGQPHLAQAQVKYSNRVRLSDIDGQHYWLVPPSLLQHVKSPRVGQGMPAPVQVQPKRLTPTGPSAFQKAVATIRQAEAKS